jgi:putative hydrolase of the HAD superfamily
MVIKGLLFDSNGTMVDIHTNEWHDDLYRVISNLLSYQGVMLSPSMVKKAYFQIMKEQQAHSSERCPEFDVVALFREMVARNATPFTHSLSHEQMVHLPHFLGQTHRAASLHRLQLYPGVTETLQRLQSTYQLGVVTNAQSTYAVPELNTVGLLHFFDPIIVSGDFGYSKPDPRLFETALQRMNLAPGEVLFIGNDMHSDIHGARDCGMKTVFFRTNQGLQEKSGVQPDYIIYEFPELLEALRFFQDR